MHRIEIEGICTFVDEHILSCAVILESATIGQVLSTDQLDFSVHVSDTEALQLATSAGDVLLSSSGEILVGVFYSGMNAIPYSTAIEYYHDDVLIGKFYALAVARVGISSHKVTAVSAAGILARQRHLGSIYTGQTFEEVAAEIIGGAFPFSCSAEVGSIPIYGWLPAGQKRENLHQLMFACGVQISKDAAGNMFFRFPSTDVVAVPEERTYEGGEAEPINPASRIEITEHTFKALDSDGEVVLYSNEDGRPAAENELVIFRDAPCHSLTTTDGLTILASGVNYAIVSGVGELRGKKYTHIQTVISENNPAAQNENVVSVADATLVNSINSLSVLRKLKAYYNSGAQKVNTEIILADEKPGQRISFTGPFMEAETGVISKMDINASTFLKANLEVITGYTPPPGGNNYKHRDIISSSGTWTVPAGVTEIMAILIGGGQGGGGASAGQNGKSAEFQKAGEGGKGGLPGTMGSPGKVLGLRLSVTPGETYPVNIGMGGTGSNAVLHGAVQSPGAAGGETSFGNYTSEDGRILQFGYVDILNGRVHARPGKDGAAGGAGAQALTPHTAQPPFIVQDGEGIDYQGVHFPGGRSHTLPAGTEAPWASVNNYYWTWGGGSGAVAGHAGADGTDGSISPWQGGKGGDAPTPEAPGLAEGYGDGGNGGNGGGGGGGAGSASNSNGTTGNLNRYGLGSAGTAGTKGGNGVVFIYY